MFIAQVLVGPSKQLKQILKTNKRLLEKKDTSSNLRLIARVEQ